MRRDYHDLVIDSFGKEQSAGYMKKLADRKIELQVAEARELIGGDLHKSELERLIGEVEYEYQTPEDRAVFQEAETMARAQMERDTSRALQSLRGPMKFTTPAQKPRPYRGSSEINTSRTGSNIANTANPKTGPVKASLQSTALDPETGVITGTTWEGTLTSQPMPGVAIRQEYQPPEPLPQADLFMGPGPEVELQRLRRRSGGAWERDEQTDAEFQEELGLVDEAYGQRGSTRYRSYSEAMSDIDEKLESIEREESGLGYLQTDRGALRERTQPETELTRARVQLSSGSYEQLGDHTERYERSKGDCASSRRDARRCVSGGASCRSSTRSNTIEVRRPNWASRSAAWSPRSAARWRWSLRGLAR
jgi:hypothetical protein